MSSRSGEASRELLYSVYFTLLYVLEALRLRHRYRDPTLAPLMSASWRYAGECGAGARRRWTAATPGSNMHASLYFTRPMSIPERMHYTDVHFASFVFKIARAHFFLMQ